MKDEIKKILDKLQKHINHEKFANYTTYELRVLLDYITNLQTIEQQYGAILSENAELENKITNLQKENMKYDQCLTELTDDYKNIQKEITNLQEENERLKKSITDIVQQNIDNSFEKDVYKTRIDKAIEYIEFEQKYSIPYKEELIELINILQGSDE